MKRRALIAGLSLAVGIAAPAAVAQPPATPGPPGQLPAPAKASPGPKDKAPGPAARKSPRKTTFLIRGCVIDPQATSASVRVLSRNAHAARLKVSDDEGAKRVRRGQEIGANLTGTRIVLVGRARLNPAGTVPRLKPRKGSVADLQSGQVVTLRYRAARNSRTVADLGPAKWLVIHGPFPRRCDRSAPPPAS
jgi:hypothetical protein